MGKTAISIREALGFGSLRNGLDAFRTEHAKARKKVEDLKRQREEIASAPPARADMYAMVDAWVDRTRESYRKGLVPFFRSAIDRPASLPMIGDTDLLSLKAGPAPSVRPAVSDGALILMLGPERIKECLHAEIDALISTEGLPADKREAKLEELDKQIDDMEQEFDRLRREAADSGLYLEG